MKRRQFISGLGAVTASGAAILGSGAFTSVQAERSLVVETAQDSDAFLKLDALGALQRSGAADLVEFEFPSLAEQVKDDVNSQNPQGLGVDSVYRFDSDVNGSDGLLRITNHGTQPVDVFAEQKATGSGQPVVTIYNVDTGDLLTSDSPYADLGVGEELRVGFQINTEGVDVQDESFDVVLTINADANHE